MNINDLKNLLSKHNINYEQWSRKKATKTIEYLKKELDDGETTLEIIDNQLTRIVKIVCIKVQFKLGEKLFILVEDKQIFFTGAVRKRCLNNISEKVKGSETPELAAYRGLKEEIGLDFHKKLIFAGETQETKKSPSYPGLNSIYNIFHYQVILGQKELEFIRFSEYQKKAGIISLFTLEEEEI